MSKIRSGVVLVVLLLLGTPVLASDQVVAPSPASFLAVLWSEVVEVVQAVFDSSETGDEPGPTLDSGGDKPGAKSLGGTEDSSTEDELGPILDPNG